jgi:hypothetical protein
MPPTVGDHSDSWGALEKRNDAQDARPTDEERDQPQVPIRESLARSSSWVSFTFGMKAMVIPKAIGLGLLTEVAVSAMSVGLIWIGGWGPCGPASFWSVAGMLVQYPGWYLEEEVLLWGMNPMAGGYSWDLPITFSFQVLLWSIVWMLCLAWRARCTGSAEPGASPNGGPAMPVGNSRVAEGPPSVS